MKPRNPPDTVGNAEVAQFTVLQVTAGPKRPAAQEVVFRPTGLRDLEGAPSLTEAHRAVNNVEAREVKGVASRPSLAAPGLSEETVGRVHDHSR